MRLLALGLILSSAPAAAQLRVVPEQPASASAARAGVDVFLINDSDTAVPAEAPATIELTAADAARVTLVPAEQPPASIAPRGFARVRYLSAGVLAVVPPPRAGAAPPTVAVWPRSAGDVAPAGEEIVSTTANGSAAGFLDRIAPYEPVYGAWGPGNSATKLQLSFAARPFGGTGGLSYFTFAYTQTMFWATDLPSGPFRATNYSPEAFFDVPVGDNARLSFGYAHDSNGNAGVRSIDVNRLVLKIAQGFDLGDGWRAEVGPQAWVYVGTRETPADLKDYWGYTGLKASIGQLDGLKLALSARGSFETGRYRTEFFASYPLRRIGGDLGVYLFGQAFTGYGEALDEFRRKESHARLGIAFTR